MTKHQLGGKNGSLQCCQCSNLRYPGVTMCPACYRRSQIQCETDVDKAVHVLGGSDGSHVCSECGKPRYPGVALCPDCWGEKNPDRGTRNTRDIVIQEKLPKDLWMAVQFAASMIRQGTPFHRSVIQSARYYKVDPSDVQRALAQRSGRNRKGKP